MSYGVKYMAKFRTASESPCEIRIEEKNYAGASRELIAGATPFVIRTSQSDFLTPVRASGGTISVFGSDYMQDLYANDPQGFKVTVVIDGNVHWIGFLTPDTFSQNFTNPEFIYEMECVSAFSTLKYKEFDLTDDFISFREIIEQARVYAGYDVIYLTNSVRGKSGRFYDFKIASANFYDELGEAMSYYEVMEEMAKYLGCCWVPFEDDLYLLDYQAIRSGYNSYTRISGTSVSNVTLSDLKTVTNYKGTGTRLSRIAGKNKAVVNCSLYEVKNIIPAFDEKGSKVFIPNPVSEIEETVKEGKENVTYKAIIRRYDQPNFIFYHYINGNPNNRVESSTPPVGNNTGSGFVRTTEFRKDEPPSRLSMTNELQVKLCNSYSAAQAGNIIDSSDPVLTIKSERNILTHKDVWFCINLQFKRSADVWNKSDKGVVFSDNGSSNIRARFKLGNLYYNGSSWGTTEATFPMKISHKKGDAALNRYYSLDNENSYDKGLGDLEGYIFKAPDFPVIGDCELTLYATPFVYFNPVIQDIQKYIYFKNIELSYAIPDESSIYGDYVDKDTKNDLIYENVIEGDYVEEADEIDLKICTNPDGKLALSSVLDGNDFLDEIVTDVFGTGKAEEILIQRVIDMYETPRFVIDPILENNAKPYTKFTEPHLNKQFLVAGGEEDVKMERTRYNLIEL